MIKRFFIIPMALICGIVLCSCSNNKTTLAQDNISEIRKELYVGESEGVTVSYVCGQREVEYSLNGIATPLIDFGVITFFCEQNFETLPTFALSIDGEIFSGSLEQNPFDGSYVADIGQCVSGQKISIGFVAKDFQKEFSLTKVNTDWEIDGYGALEIACNSLGKNFEHFMNDKDFAGECYIKIVNDSNLSSDYFWYVNIIGKNKESFSVVIDPHSGEILAKKLSI